MVNKEKEEIFRNAARLIEKRIRDYSSSYAYKDKQDLLAMVALECATRQLTQEEAEKRQLGAWNQRLEEVDRVLSEYLSEENVL
jgi:cell division protein ZapA